MFKVKTIIEGDDIVIENFDRIRRYTGLALRDGLMREAVETLEASRNYVPTRYRALVNSGRVESHERRIATSVVYGGDFEGENIYYGWIVHEDLSAYHDDGMAKFLELPFLERTRDIGVRAAGWVFAATLRR